MLAWLAIRTWQQTVKRQTQYIINCESWLQYKNARLTFIHHCCSCSNDEPSTKIDWVRLSTHPATRRERGKNKRRRTEDHKITTMWRREVPPSSLASFSASSFLPKGSRFGVLNHSKEKHVPSTKSRHTSFPRDPSTFREGTWTLQTYITMSPKSPSQRVCDP